MPFSLTGISTLVGVIVMFMAWLFVSRRIGRSQVVVSRPVGFLRNFFLYMFWFFVFMSAPHLLLYVDPAQFPLAMAWGYTVGHIFLYIAFIYIARTTFAIVPQLADKEQIVIIAGIVANVAITLLTFTTMVLGVQPVFQTEQHITQLNASVAVGASIGVLALLCMFPPAILFLINAFKQQGGLRARSVLLGSGLLIMTIAGPLHDVAVDWLSFLIADVFTIVAITLLGLGVVYRININLSLGKDSQFPAPSGN